MELKKKLAILFFIVGITLFIFTFDTSGALSSTYSHMGAECDASRFDCSVYSPLFSILQHNVHQSYLFSVVFILTSLILFFSKR